MRTPNQKEIKQLCQQAIPSILAQLKIFPPKSITLDDQGWVNVCIFADDVVIRFNARDQHLPKYQREKLMFEKFSGTFPVPQCLLLDESKKIIPFDYMICKKLPGKNLEQHWGSLDDVTRKALAYQAGQILAKIHSVNCTVFGEPTGKGPLPQTKAWPDYLRFILNYHLNEAMSLGIFSSEKQRQFLNRFEEGISLLEMVKTPFVVHGDFHLGNLLFVNDKITGVLDFEWSLNGDPLFDICSDLQDMDSKWPGSQQSFFEGYGLREFSENDLQKMKLYKMIKNIELCVVAKKFFSDDEVQEFVKVTESVM